MVSNASIKEQIFSSLYGEYFNAEGNSNLPELRDQRGWDKQATERVIDEMVESGVIEPSTFGGNYRITVAGIRQAETNGWAPNDLARSNNLIRLRVLELLADLREKHGRMSSLHFLQIAPEFEASQQRVAWNLTFMEQVGLIENFGAGDRITSIGTEVLGRQRQQAAIEEDFDRLSMLAPQMRGKELEKLLARVVTAQGWSQVTNVQTNNEEMDLIVRKDREYYLIECKWLKDPVEAAVIHGLFGKLEKRAGSRGIVVSMNGFSQGAVEAVTELSHGHLVFLFGRTDTQNLISRQKSLDDLLTEKFDALVMYKKAQYE